jgi:hypothetical protein
MTSDPGNADRNQTGSSSRGQGHEAENEVSERPPPSKETLAEGLRGDNAGHVRDTPGRPKSGSSRQQTTPGQSDSKDSGR